MGIEHFDGPFFDILSACLLRSFSFVGKLDIRAGLAKRRTQR
jgi:hypothetical protein